MEKTDPCKSVAIDFVYFFAKLSLSAGICTRYHAIAARTIIPNPPHARGHPKSDAAAETLGTSRATPRSAATIAARRAQLLSRSNPQPMSAATTPTSRNINGPANSSPCRSGAPSLIDKVPGDTSIVAPVPPKYAATRKKIIAIAVTPAGRCIIKGLSGMRREQTSQNEPATGSHHRGTETAQKVFPLLRFSL
jgi:hypothetical protein